jgi:hypothetical protein
MSALGLRLLWAVGQVTLVALGALALSAVAGRRCPRTGSAVAALGLAALVVLTALALLPLPTWWAWPVGTAPAAGIPETRAAVAAAPRAEPGHIPVSSRAEVPANAAPDPDSAGGSFFWLQALWQRCGTLVRPAGDGPQPWPRLAAGLFLGGAALGLLRLVLGVWAVGRCRLRGVPVRDAALLGLLDSLRGTMGCRRAVAVRESAELGGPATVGCWRPVLLLPPTWRAWSAGELRAVLAHELAHVCRADYAAWLVARVGVALHFYHPLVYWLASRLHLQQELAADALAARPAGGQPSYLRALASLALRQEAQTSWGPVRAFLPARGTLMRRIGMLRIEERAGNSAWPRAVAVALLGAVALLASALRGPARAGDDERPPVKEATRAAFVCPPWTHGALGIYGIRPAALFADPALKKYAGLANQALAEVLKEMGASGTFPAIEDVEQVCGIVTHHYEENAKEGQRNALLLSLQVIRTTHDHDWKAFINALVPARTAIAFEGREYYHARPDDVKKAAFPGILRIISGQDSLPDGLCFYLPDARTLVLGSEEQIRQIIHRGGPEVPDWVRAAGWEGVARGVMAVALTNRGEHLKKVWQAAAKERWWPTLPGVRVVTARPSAFVFGADFDGALQLDALAGCASARDATAVANAILGLLSRGQAALGTRRGAAEGKVEPGLALLKALLDQACVGIERGADAGHKGALAHARTRARVGLAEVVDFLTRFHAEEVRDEGK